MQRASETIGALAGALAKAQTQLVNPENPWWRPSGRTARGGASRPFAMHHSRVGWRLCAKSSASTRSPRFRRRRSIRLRDCQSHNGLGPRLRRVDRVRLAGMPGFRYGFSASYGGCADLCATVRAFALVGIAGEDDLDAPDLQVAVSEIGPERPKANGGDHLHGGREHDQQAAARPDTTSARNGKPAPKQAEAILGLHASAKLRERLIAEIRCLSSPEDAAEWVRQSLPEKNRLRASDAAQVEAIFEAKLAQLTAFSRREPNPRRPPGEFGVPTPEVDLQSDESRGPSPGGIDKCVLTLPEPRGFATATTSGWSQPVLALCAAGFLRIPIICGLRRAAPFRRR